MIFVYLSMVLGMEKYKDRMEEFYIFTLDELRQRRYPIPTFLDPTSKLPDDEWKETRPASTPSDRKRLIALDCEMVSINVMYKITILMGYIGQNNCWKSTGSCHIGG